MNLQTIMQNYEVVNTKEKLGQVIYESANYYAKLCDIFVLKYIRLRNFIIL
jgi:hypothetical protein